VLEEAQQLRVSLSTDPIKLRGAIVAKMLQQAAGGGEVCGAAGPQPAAADHRHGSSGAGARVRLQQQGAQVDLGAPADCRELLAPGDGWLRRGKEGRAQERHGRPGAAGGRLLVVVAAVVRRSRPGGATGLRLVPLSCCCWCWCCCWW